MFSVHRFVLCALATLGIAVAAANGAKAQIFVQYNAAGQPTRIQDTTVNEAVFRAVDTHAGKALAVGRFKTSTGKLATLLARYVNGQLDGTYGYGGVSTFRCTSNTGSSSNDEEAVDVAIDPDGRALVLVAIRKGDAVSSCVVRVASNGAPDTTFGNKGIAVLALPSGIVPESIAIDPRATREIVIMGNTDITFTVAKLSAGGLTRPFIASQVAYGPNSVGGGRDLAIDSSGRPIVVGRALPVIRWEEPRPLLGPFMLGIARFTPSLQFDAAFDGTGRRMISGFIEGKSVVAAGSNILVVAADDQNHNQTVVTYLRFRGDGSRTGTRTLQTGQGHNGFSAWESCFNESSHMFIAVPVSTGNFPNGAIYTAKIDVNTLALDPTYGSHGSQVTAFPGRMAEPTDISVEPGSHRPVVVGAIDVDVELF